MPHISDVFKYFQIELTEMPVAGLQHLWWTKPQWLEISVRCQYMVRQSVLLSKSRIELAWRAADVIVHKDVLGTG